MAGIARWPMVALTQTITCALVVASVLTLGVGGARAAAPPTPWDGVNPFRCTIQDAGQGTSVPDPGADPYCVRFDKTNQNVTELGLVTFLSLEPARVNEAAPKCFYYQEDHWRGSVIQSNQQTVVYEFYGHYFYNKATGDGGVWVTGFTIAGQTFDPRSLPGFPPQWDQYFGPGTGGLISHNDVPVDPNCAAKAQQAPGAIYARPARSHCLRAHGQITGRRLGPVRLDTREGAVRARLGPPQATKRGFLRYCLASGGSLLVGGRAGAGGAHARAVILVTSSRSFTLRRARGRTVAVGASLHRLRDVFPSARLLLRVGRADVFSVAPRRDGDDSASGGTVVAGVVRGRVAYLATYDARVITTNSRLAAYLRRSR